MTVHCRSVKTMAKEKKPNKLIVEANNLLKEIGLDPIYLHRNDENLPELAMIRIEEFHKVCEAYDILPTIEGLALTLGVNRKELIDWIQGQEMWVKETHLLEVLLHEYQFLNACYSAGMNEGNIDKVVGIFYSKNNLEYTNEDPEAKPQQININFSAAQLIEEAKNLQIGTKK